MENNNQNMNNIDNAEDMSHRCDICHNQITGRALTDTCLHEFCHSCLLEASHQHNRCPTCRQEYHNILHDIVSEAHFQQSPVMNSEQTSHRLHMIVINSRMHGLRRQLIDERNRFNRDIRSRSDDTDDDNQISVEELQRSVNFLNQIITLFDDINDDLNSGALNRNRGQTYPTPVQVNPIPTHGITQNRIPTLRVTRLESIDTIDTIAPIQPNSSGQTSQTNSVDDSSTQTKPNKEKYSEEEEDD